MIQQINEKPIQKCKECYTFYTHKFVLKEGPRPPGHHVCPPSNSPPSPSLNYAADPVGGPGGTSPPSTNSTRSCLLSNHLPARAAAHLAAPSSVSNDA